MLKKFQDNGYIGHFFVYSASSFCAGCVMGALGPIIPFLSDQYHVSQTQYSSLFMARGIAFLMINLFMHRLLQLFSMHAIIIISSLICSLFYALFCYFQTVFMQGALIFIGSIGLAATVVGSSIAFMGTHIGKNQESWLQLKEAAFGIGSLLGPILVAYLQYKAYLLIGIFMIAVIPFYIYLPSSQIVQKEIHRDNENQGTKLLQGVPSQSQKYFSFAFFMIIGLQVCFAGWIPSYAVIKQTDSKTQATKYTSIFWAATTLTRFITVFINGRIQNKIRISLIAAILTCIVCCLFILAGSPKIAIYLSSILLGVLLSPNFPWMMTIAGQFNYRLTVEQLTAVFVGGSIGQGLVSAIFGFFMQQFGIDSFFVLLTVSCVLIYLSFHQIISILRQQEEISNLIQLKEKLKT